MTESEEVWWDEDKNRLKSRKIRSLGSLVFNEIPVSEPSSDASIQGLTNSFKKKGLFILPWGKEDLRFWHRCLFPSFVKERISWDEWPDFTEEALIGTLSFWFLPLLVKGRLEGSLKDGLASLLSWEQRNYLDRMVPDRMPVPSGSRLRIDYSDPGLPALDVRIQELFGLTETPLIAGAVPLLIRLLNPAGRPIQVTKDLKSFWENTYPEVRKELRGRYPKHYWPENPYEALPTNRVRPRR
jgi:ATP-dependent helicase HrpB